MLVRRATPDDVEGFVAVVTAVAAEGRWIATEPPIDGDALAASIHAMLADGEAVFVLDVGERVAGTLVVHSTRAPGVLSLGMSILAELRGRGYGRLMLQAAVDHARAAGAHKLELEVWPDNERAIGLYASFGFQTEGLRRSHYRREDGRLRSSQVMALLLED